MKTYEFTIIASGLDPSSDDFEDRFFAAGCDDATIAFVKGLIVLEFGREARNFVHAIVSGVECVRNAGAKVLHLEPDYLVNLTDIADRCNLTRAAVSHFAKGTRGVGFPAPVARVTTESPLWDWVHVARWMFKRRRLSLESLVQAKIVREVNRAVCANPDRIDESRFEHRLLQRLAA
jgi:hypothetical protein